MRSFESADALQVITGVEVEHLNGVVHLCGNEKVTASEIHGEVIEVARNLRHVNCFDQRDGRGVTSYRCLRSQGDRACKNEKAIYFHVALVGNP